MHKTCHIGSCQRHQACMYVPCRASAPVVLHRQSGGQTAEAFALRPYQRAFLDLLEAEPPRKPVGDLYLAPRYASLVRWLVGVGEYDPNDPCDEWAHPHYRPALPMGEAHVWYRGWEVGYSHHAAYWSGEGWIAYKGGCDLGAPEVRSASYVQCLHAIDDEEDAPHADR